MQDLIKQEMFEIEVLERLNSCKLLTKLIFSGGTMLRLCFGLDRFSVDLDFWVTEKVDSKKLYNEIETCLSESYSIKDKANKFNTILFEIKTKDYPRSLKLEIRKEPKRIKTGSAIAYSKYSSSQVFLKVVSLEEMASAKVEAFLERKEIRDVFDLEFLVKKGVVLDRIPLAQLKQVIAGIDKLTNKDYAVKLGSLLEEKQRKYYNSENFKILRLAIKETH